MHSIDNNLIIPGRSEVVRQIFVNTFHKEILIKNKYISDGVIIASIIAISNKQMKTQT